MFKERAMVAYLTMPDVLTRSESQWSLHIPTFCVAQSHCVLYYHWPGITTKCFVVNWPIKLQIHNFNTWDFIPMLYKHVAVAVTCTQSVKRFRECSHWKHVYVCVVFDGATASEPTARRLLVQGPVVSAIYDVKRWSCSVEIRAVWLAVIDLTNVWNFYSLTLATDPLVSVKISKWVSQVYEFFYVSRLCH